MILHVKYLFFDSLENAGFSGFICVRIPAHSAVDSLPLRY